MNVLSLTRPNRATRGDQISTKREAARAYFAHGSGRVLTAAVVLLVTARFAIGGIGPADLVAPLVTIAITGTVEWVIHRFLLHAPEEAWTNRVLGLGAGHRHHHLVPNELHSLLLRGTEAALFVVLLGAFSAAWTVPLMWLTGSAVLGPVVTAWACAAIGLAHYEWVHLLVHTKYRPATRYYRRLARNHRLHHYRNEHYWLGVTANSGDRLLRTYPKHKTDVALSATARTLAPNG